MLKRTRITAIIVIEVEEERVELHDPVHFLRFTLSTSSSRT